MPKKGAEWRRRLSAYDYESGESSYLDADQRYYTWNKRLRRSTTARSTATTEGGLLGVPLFREEMRDIWKEQKHHVPSCIQDPPNVPLYTITGQAVKGGVRLPVLRCARGSTSLESFHLHLARSVLCALVQSRQTHQISTGTSLSVQVHLRDIGQPTALPSLPHRWHNEVERSPGFCSHSIIQREPPNLQREASTQGILHNNRNLSQQVNELSEEVMGTKVFPLFQPPPAYTGELFGVEYLLAQSGSSSLQQRRTLTPVQMRGLRRTKYPGQRAYMQYNHYDAVKSCNVSREMSGTYCFTNG